MGTTPEDAYRLQAKAEQWQTLATRQQELAVQLTQLAGEQRELVALWDASEAHELVGQARQIEEGLRTLSAQVLRLEEGALDMVARAIADEARALRPE